MGNHKTALDITATAEPQSGDGYAFAPGCKNAFEHWTISGNDPELTDAYAAMVASQWADGADSLTAFAAMVRYARACEARASKLVQDGYGEHGDAIMVQCLVDVTSLVRRGGERAEELKRELESRFSPIGIQIVADFFAKRDAQAAEGAARG